MMEKLACLYFMTGTVNFMCFQITRKDVLANKFVQVDWYVVKRVGVVKRKGFFPYYLPAFVDPHSVEEGQIEKVMLQRDTHVAQNVARDIRGRARHAEILDLLDLVHGVKNGHVLLTISLVDFERSRQFLRVHGFDDPYYRVWTSHTCLEEKYVFPPSPNNGVYA